MMAYQQIKRLFAIVAVLQLSACATILNGGSQRIYVETTPPSNVNAIVHDKKRTAYQVQLPAVISATPSSFSNLFIELDNDCYQPLPTKVDKRIASAYWLNILNFHGFYVDYFTSGMWQYDPRVIIPLRPISENNGSATDCLPEKYATNQNGSRQGQRGLSAFGLMFPEFANERLNNVLSVNWVIAQTNDARSDKGARAGGGFSYLRHFNQQDMMNISIRGSGRSGSCIGDNCRYYFTEQESVLVSFRRYLTPASNFFGGLGAARVRITQTEEEYYYSFDSVADNNSASNSWTDEINTLFFEMGWLARVGVITYKVRAVMDFSDIGLAHPSLRNKYYLARDLSNAGVERRASEYRAASRLTGFELGVGFSF